MSTPEELERAKAIARQVMNESNKENGLKSINRGQIFLFVTAGIFFLNMLFFYFKYENIFFIYSFAPIVVIYVILGIIFFRNPLVVSSTGLGIFGLIVLLDAIADPTSLFKGVVLKALIIFSLTSALINSKKYQNEVRKKPANSNTDIIDAEF